MNAIIVQKYGGSSLATAERVINVARRIAARAADARMAVVVSAQGNLTDRLMEKAREINPAAHGVSRRELDMLLATGEQQAAALVAMACTAIGFPAVSLTAAQAGICSTAEFGAAKIEKIDTSRLRAELGAGHIVIVAGFTGAFAGENGQELTTLGRGASDTTAVALAAALEAEACEIFTDVEGVYTADPRLVSGARKHAAISYDDMLELASSGAKVLHNRAVEMAKTYRVPLYVASSMSQAAGTWIREDNEVEKLMVSGLAADRNVALITVPDIGSRPGSAYGVFKALADAGISVDIIQTTGNGLSFTVHRADADAAVAAVPGKAEVNAGLAKLAVVGAGMATNHGVAAAMFGALGDSGVNVHLISTSEIKIAVLVDEKDINTAVTAVHEKFGVEL